MSTTDQRFDKLLKAMVEGEPPKGRKSALKQAVSDGEHQADRGHRSAADKKL